MPETGPQRGPRRGGPPWIIRFAATALLVLGGAALLRAQPAVSVTAAESGIWGVALLFLVLLLCSGFVSASETALFSLDKLDLSMLRSDASWSNRLILRLVERPNDTLITILILNNFINISASLTAGAMMDRAFGNADALALTLAALLATTGILLVGEILPKMLAHLNPVRGSRVLAPPLSLAAWVLTPVRISLRWSMHGLFRAFHIPEDAAGEEISEEELKAMISSGEISQVLEEDEREMIDGVFDLRRTTVDEIMTPRLSVVAVPDDLEQPEMIRRLRESSVNRVLVYTDTLDQLVGFMLVKEVLLNPDRPWREHLREPITVPERIGLLDLLKIFRQRRGKMAVVIDEYGGVAGIVTLQDMLEEIVGDIYEAHEHAPTEVERTGDGQWQVAGAIDLDRLGEELGIQFPDQMGRTAGGFVMNRLGRIPRAGDEVRHEQWLLRVSEMAGRRVHRLEVSGIPAPASDRPEEARP